MLLTKNITSTGTQGTHAALTSREEDQQKISMMMIDTYSSPVTPIREIVVNGLEVAQNSPVEVKFESNQTIEKNNIFNNSKVVKSGNITIVDDGPGMSRDFVENFLFRMGASTKDGDENATGGFGIGAKSVFSITNSVTWRTTHDGVTTVAVVSRNGDTFDAIYESFETNDPNGTTVIIPVGGEKYTTILENIHTEYFDFVSPEDLVMTVDGVEVNVGKYHVSDMKDNEVRLIDRYNADNNTVVVLSNSEVPYFYTLSQNDDDISLNAILSHAAEYDHNFVMNRRNLVSDKTIIVRMDIAGHVIPNRESLKRSEELSEKIADAINSYYKKEVDSYKEIIDNAKTLSEWRDALNTVKDTIKNNNTFVSSVNDPINNIFSKMNNYYYSTNQDIPNIDGKSIAFIDYNSYEDIRNKRSLDNESKKINYLLGVNSHKSVKIDAWISNKDDIFEEMGIDTEVIFVEKPYDSHWSSPGYNGKNGSHYEFKLSENLNDNISIEGLKAFASNLNLNHYQLVMDMISQKKLTTPKEIILAVSGAKDLYDPYELRIKAMEEGGKLISENRKTGVKKPRQKKEPVHPLTVINTNRDEDDVWFSNPSEFISWVKDNDINKIIVLSGTYEDKNKRKYSKMDYNTSEIKMISEMYADGTVFIYAPGRDNSNTYNRISNIFTNYNKKNNSILDIDLEYDEGRYSNGSFLIIHYLHHKVDGINSKYIPDLLCAYSCRNDITIDIDGNNVNHYDPFASIASMSYVAEDEIIDDKGTSLLDYLKKNYSLNSTRGGKDIDISIYNDLIDVLRDVYPRDNFVKHINNFDLVSVAKRMMPDEDKMKIEQISNLIKYKKNDDWYYSDRDKYFLTALKSLDKFDEFIDNL